MWRSGQPLARLDDRKLEAAQISAAVNHPLRRYGAVRDVEAEWPEGFWEELRVAEQHPLWNLSA